MGLIIFPPNDSPNGLHGRQAILCNLIALIALMALIALIALMAAI